MKTETQNRDRDRGLGYTRSFLRLVKDGCHKFCESSGPLRQISGSTTTRPHPTPTDPNCGHSADKWVKVNYTNLAIHFQIILQGHYLRHVMRTYMMSLVMCLVMYLSDIKSCVARTSIGAQFLSVGAQFLSIGAQDAPACYGLCEK